MSWITDDFLCTVEDCRHRWDTLQKRNDRKDELPCPKCEGKAVRTFGVPNMMKASYHMGKERDDGYKKIKEANDLTMDMYDTPENKRGDLKREIKKLTGEVPD